MGQSIGNMFNIGKIFDPLLDSIGLGALKPLVSAAFNFATGNVMGLIGDLGNLIQSFDGGSFMNNVAQNPPLSDEYAGSEEVGDTGGTQSEFRADNDDQSEYDSGNTRSGSDNQLSSQRIGELFNILGQLFSGKDPGSTFEALGKLFNLLSETAENRETVQAARSNMQFYGGSVTFQA